MVSPGLITVPAFLLYHLAPESAITCPLARTMKILPSSDLRSKERHARFSKGVHRRRCDCQVIDYLRNLGPRPKPLLHIERHNDGIARSDHGSRISPVPPGSRIGNHLSIGTYDENPSFI